MSKLLQYKKGAFGYIPLSSVVNRYMIHSFNQDRKYYANYLRLAADVWKTIFTTQLRGYKEKLIWVNRRTNTAPLPFDFEPHGNIGCSLIDDCNKRVPLTFDGKRLTGAIPANGQKGCGCKACNCDNASCSTLFGSTMTEEDVEINGTIYKRIIKNRVEGNGDIFRETTEPFATQPDPDQPIVVQFRTKEELIERIELKPCGCVPQTQEAVAKVYSICGCNICEPCCDDDRMKLCRPAGKYKIDTDTGQIYFFDCSPRLVAYKYRSTGSECDCGDEVMIPEYAADAVYNGMYFYGLRFRNTVPAYQHRMAKEDFNKSIDELIMYLNPLDVVELRALQNKQIQW